MNKKRLIIILLFLLVIICLFVNNIIKINPKKYVLEKHEDITLVADELLNNLNKATVVYEKRNECPDIDKIELLYLNLSIDIIGVEKSKEFFGDDYVDRVIIFLHDKPDDEEYFQCGIYYSPEGCAIDYYGHPVDDTDGVYVYDGRPKKVKIMYKSEKICDNWYYFEDAVW
ncbi:hypothetical protein [Pseudobutyrivibrio sp.]|uniref:hypothetical protein n=1 Tax=Pseudobutyrivibrio sp. TaxID=2014367 RepID=UPI0038681948